MSSLVVLKVLFYALILQCNAMNFGYDNEFNFDSFAQGYLGDDDLVSVFEDEYEYQLSDAGGESETGIEERVDDEFVDNEMEGENEYDLGFFIKPLYAAVASKPNEDIPQEGLKRTEQTVLLIEKELVALENVDRVALIHCDDSIPKSMGAMGNGEEADIEAEKAKEGKQTSEKAEMLIPKLREKQEEVIKTVPRREAIRMARRNDLLHRFDLLADKEESI